MIDELFTFPSTIERLRQGPLSEHLDAYAAAVAEQGYAPHSIGRQIVAIGDFSRWLEHKHLAIEALDQHVVDRFLRWRRRQQRVGRGDPKALDRMLSMLRQKGIVKPCPPPVVGNACSKIAAGYHCYLLQELGRSPSTAKNYVPFIAQFLMERFQNRTPDLALLRAPDVTGFVIRHAHRLSPVDGGEWSRHRHHHTAARRRAWSLAAKDGRRAGKGEANGLRKNTGCPERPTSPAPLAGLRWTRIFDENSS